MSRADSVVDPTNHDPIHQKVVPDLAPRLKLTIQRDPAGGVEMETADEVEEADCVLFGQILQTYPGTAVCPIVVEHVSARLDEAKGRAESSDEVKVILGDVAGHEISSETGSKNVFCGARRWTDPATRPADVSAHRPEETLAHVCDLQVTASRPAKRRIVSEVEESTSYIVRPNSLKVNTHTNHDLDCASSQVSLRHNLDSHVCLVQALPDPFVATAI